MTPADVLNTLLKSYQRYYNVQAEGIEPPFVAEAVFHSHDEQYFLTKRAKLSESEDHEYVYFATGGDMGLAEVQALVERAWTLGEARVQPHANHRSTNIALVLLVERISEEARRYLRSVRYSRNYRFLLHGWSSFRLIALETTSGALTWNRRGRDLAKLFRNIHL